MSQPTLKHWRRPPSHRSLSQRRTDIAEFLRTLSGVDFRRVDVAFAVDGEIVNPVKLTGVAAVAPERADDLAVFAHQRADFVVGSVRVHQEGLVGIGPEIEIPD